jgi:type III restriction enzyme
MDLKRYQRRVVDEVERYLAQAAKERADGNLRHAAIDAWRALRLGDYRERLNGLGEDLPTFCIKVPTGGGKTLLATQALGSLYRTILKDRNGAGLVLWVVPSSQIYRDTLRRLRDRRDMYRVMLEHAVSRRIELWEKHEIARLSAARLRDCLNILVVQLASTNRETKEQLKFFKDSGGNIVQHFPPEDDWPAQKALKEQVPNLDMIEEDPQTGRYLVATSIGNLVRLCRPPVILDEGHKATSKLAQETIEGFNASAIVELSATPHAGANILSRVTGQELLDEEMIKLPLNIATSLQKNWKDVLTQARDKREALAAKAAEHGTAGQRRLIRPIVLVQVERTGKDQQDTGFIHSNQVKTYLMERLNVPQQAIAIKSAQTDDIEGLDLLDAGCPLEWIITKSALQEGWDCPFAYILVSLNNTGSGLSMTQLVGRVLRQPFQERTPFPELNESYIYCLHKRAGEISREVKTALEKEGYEGEAESRIVDATQKQTRPHRTVRIRDQFLRLYRRPFEGKIYLPHFCVKNGGGYEALDYFRHLVGRLDVDSFRYAEIDWDLQLALTDAKERFYRVTLGEDMERVRETDVDLWERDAEVLGWLAANLPFDYLSHKQLRRIAERVYAQLVTTQMFLKDRLALVKFVVRDHVERFIQEELDRLTEAAFRDLHAEQRLQFYLECAHCRFEIPEQIQIRSLRPLSHDDGSQVRKSLFDYVEHESTNTYERAVALCLDRHERVLWWYRNLVGPEHFAIQGYRKNRIRPDFVVQGGTEDKPLHRVLVTESKGRHLEGNPDTTYKRKVAKVFDEVGQEVPWQQLGEDFQNHVFRFQVLDEAQDLGRDWEDELRDVLERLMQE